MNNFKNYHAAFHPDFCVGNLPFPVLFFFCLLLLFMITPLYAGTDKQLTADAQFDYANLLFEKKDYAAAAAEYMRFAFFFPKDERVEQVQFKIGLSYFYQKHYEKASQQFTEILVQHGPDEIGIQSGLFISRCHLALNDFQSATGDLHSLVQLTDNVNFQNEIYYFLGWLYVEYSDFYNARLCFGKIKYSGFSEYPMESVIPELDKYNSIAYKNPALAGFLSLIPGGGYLYCNRYNDALISFLINAAMAGSAYESFDKDLNVLGGIIAVVGIGFYGGNIYGGISSAYKYNQRKDDEFINKLKNKFNIDLMTSIHPNGVSLTIQHRFK